jgi:hypothetical protein
MSVPAIATDGVMRQSHELRPTWASSAYSGRSLPLRAIRLTLRVQCVVMLWLGLCFGVEAPAQTNRFVQPLKFSFSTGGMVGFQTAKWNGKALVYEETKYGSVVTNRTIKPTNKQWREFWAATERMRLSKWQRFYENPNILDGWVWSIEIEHGTQEINTFGRNAVPDDADLTKAAKDSHPNKTFNAFKSALEGLLGFKLW